MSEPRMHVQTRNGIQGIMKAIALEAASRYCLEHGLSLEKLKAQKCEIIENAMVFAQPTGVKPDGLRNDLATRPHPTLILKLDKNGNLLIETTEHTKKYLAN